LDDGIKVNYSKIRNILYKFDEKLCRKVIYILQNDTIYGIFQRAENEKIHEPAIRKLFQDDNPPYSYCGITQKQINDLDAYVKENNQKYGLTIRARGRKLEVDQISPKDGNITLCCYWCNNAKTDTFSVKEFKEIARGINVA